MEPVPLAKGFPISSLPCYPVSVGANATLDSLPEFQIWLTTKKQGALLVWLSDPHNVILRWFRQRVRLNVADLTADSDD
jgi:hypothetical protein